MGQVKMPGNIMSQVPKEQLRTQQSRMKEMGKNQIPTDLGLLPLTFVPPPAKELYHMFKADKSKILPVSWLWMKRKFTGWFG
jgi:hypothetical protein